MTDAFTYAGEPWAEGILDEAIVRLDRTLDRAGVDAELSFDVAVGAPELALLQSLAPGSVSFAVGSDASLAIRDAAALLDQLIERAQTAIHVETRRGTQLMAATTINLGGDTHNAVASGAVADDFVRHREAVAAQLRARAVRLRTLSAVVQAAARISIATTTGNPFMAVRAVWRFVSDVMAERAR